MIFSHRYRRALQEQTLRVDLDHDVRRRLLRCMYRFNPTSVDPEDSVWGHVPDALADAYDFLEEEEEWDRQLQASNGEPVGADILIEHLMLHGEARNAIDLVELFIGQLTADRAQQARAKVNDILEAASSPWRLIDLEFIKLSDDFVGAQIIQSAMTALAAGPYAGPADEFSQALRELASKEVKDAITHACKSYESLLSILTEVKGLNADKLTQELLLKGYLDDIPEEARKGFRSNVLMALPTIRNKLAAHGQGADVVDVPEEYATLAVQIAGAMHNFLIAKRMAMTPTPVVTEEDDDPIPF